MFIGHVGIVASAPHVPIDSGESSSIESVHSAEQR